MRQWRSNSLRDLICRVDVTAFAAVLVALLAMFLAQSATWRDLPRDGADLVRVSHPQDMDRALREDALWVAITRDGKIFLGVDLVSVDSLGAAIREQVRLGAQRKIYICPDERAYYGTVKQALDAVQSAGVENVAFIVGERNRLAN